ncbi:hypothetical protein BKA56DRAFT_665182 [Ilyonectria sp. MPI-CAGE-AT-0026]|nr:hypothetical protein BKA56DRAFT_665182 [Ilyonectria sp. MPI-CAGE-AT-0026]
MAEPADSRQQMAVDPNWDNEPDRDSAISELFATSISASVLEYRKLRGRTH